MDGDAVRAGAHALATVEATLETWRAQGVDRIDPLRFDLIAALAARAHAHAGESRRLLEARLAGLVQAYASGPAASSGDVPLVDSVPLDARGRGALGELLAGMDRATTTHAAAVEAPGAAPASALLPLLDEFRRIWTWIRTGSQLRESLAQVPADAGPLNSDMLVHRSITLMRDVSPDYLHHFVAYVDTLSSLQRMCEDNPAANTGAAASVPGSTSGKRATRSRTRKPRR